MNGSAQSASSLLLGRNLKRKPGQSGCAVTGGMAQGAERGVGRDIATTSSNQQNWSFASRNEKPRDAGQRETHLFCRYYQKITFLDCTAPYRKGYNGKFTEIQLGDMWEEHI